MAYFVGIDIGGTFTDAVVTLIDEDDARAETRDTSRQEHGADGY